MSKQVEFKDASGVTIFVALGHDPAWTSGMFWMMTVLAQASVMAVAKALRRQKAGPLAFFARDFLPNLLLLP